MSALRRFAFVVAALASAASASAAELTPAECRALASEPQNQVFGHFRYEQREPNEVGACRLAPQAREAAESLIRTARESGVTLWPQSCFRSVVKQQDLFCGEAERRGIAYSERARVSAPPGYSEHHTGFTIDFATTTCVLEACFAHTPAGQFLFDNAAKFGFELSFPKRTRQPTITYEPWHYRFVGSDDAVAVFSEARARYPACPRVPPAIC